MQTVRSATFSGKRVLVRVDFNVPVDAAFKITDDARIRKSLPTLEHILANGGSVILMSHFGRPKKGPEDKYSLRHVQNHLAELLNRPVLFVQDCVGEAAEAVCSQLAPGDVVLLENTRFHPEEEKGDRAFAERLARLGDVYVNDAFGTAHRAHASTTIVADFFTKKYAGFLLASEVENAEKVLHHAEHPYVAIVGGAKVSDKILIIERLLDRVDTLLIGGGMAYTFLKAQGYEIGTSLCESDRLETALALLEKAQSKEVKLLLPIDSVVADRFAADATPSTHLNTALPANQMGLDIGPQSLKLFSEALHGSRTILWNGPVGVFEFEAFSNGTLRLAKAIADATAAGAYSLIGGGDSAAAVEQAGLADQMSYISTGGGALLEYLEGKVLPGVAALG
jgi:phosphoglycerate kinase